ncbi:cell division site-positioning protein MapZ family protein [uncultured Vagococcus sp.]|uniref:cell division site-positioning protein MapZ family protein n=1 Tax=uncultured Vagococcus sp. TaxID=189676 RepID=UPI0028D12B71|nr:cell division site-positioning protein MapZ family protein [uncultured Vagococcus sp.]
MEKGKKCPNCGYVSTKNEEFCPNCDRFEPTFEDFTKELGLDKGQTPEAEVVAVEPTIEEEPETPVAVEPEISEPVAEPPVVPSQPIEEPMIEPMVEPIPEPTPEPQIEKFAAKEVIPEDPYETKADPASNDSFVSKKAPVASQSEMNEPTPPKKNYNKIIALVVLALLVIGGSVFGFTKYQAKKEADQVVAIKKEAALLENDLDKLYFNEEKVFLSENFDGDTLKELEGQVADFKEAKYVADLKPVVADLKERGDLLVSVNNLFKEPLIKGDKLVEGSVLKQAEAVVPKGIEKPADKFEELVNKGLKVASDQVAANKKAKELVAKVYGDDAKKEATRAQYDEAKGAVKSLKDSSLQKDYDTKLAKVDALIVAEEKKETQRKADEQAAAIAQAQASLTAQAPQTQTPQASGSQTNNQGTYRTGIALQNESSGTTYGDWSWGEGIQAKIINECIRRGYIVEGGYELRQRIIINGEAYYDLFATSTQSSLLKDRSESELPIYLVTINAKTGWFKGEGPN